MRHKGGGHKQHYRIVDFKRNKDGIAGESRAHRIRSEPQRQLALLLYADGERRYVIAQKGVAAGTQLMSGSEAPIKVGNTLPLRNIPVGTTICCVEMMPGKGAQIARAAGAVGAAARARRRVRAAAAALRRDPPRAHQLPRDDRRSRQRRALAGIDRQGGRVRWRGVRPTVRGVAMNPIDHPHGGGEGRTRGSRHPVRPWGVLTKGYKTRKNKRTQTA